MLNGQKEKAAVSLEQTKSVMDRYFETMGEGGDFSEFFADDVTWTSMDTGQDSTDR
jgi:hypothetical protein